MNEHAIPTYLMMLAPTLESLDRLGGSATNDELDAAVIARMGLTAAQLAVHDNDKLHPTRTKVAQRLSVTRTYLKKFGYITNSRRGLWTLDPSSAAILGLDRDGAAAALRAQDIKVREAKRGERAERTAKSGAPVPEADPSIEPDELSEMLNDSY